MFRSLSIKWKMAAMTAFSTAVALLLAFFILIIYDLGAFERNLETDLSALAKVVGANSAQAVKRGDSKTATTALQAFAARKEIMAAGIYNAQGKLVGRYVREGVVEAKLPARPKPNGALLENGSLEVFTTIVSAGKPAGYVYISCDTRTWFDRIKRYGTVVGTVLLSAVLLAFAISWLLQRTISNPIVRLADAMRSVSDHRTYGLRVDSYTTDEIGSLVDGFNTMLSEIQERDAALQRANDELELRVGSRTKELEQEVRERTKAEEEVGARNIQLLALHQISQMDLGGQKLQVGLQQIVEEISAATGFPIVVMEFYEPRRTTLTFGASTGPDKQVDALVRKLPSEARLSHIVAKSGSPLVDTVREPNDESQTPLLKSAGLKSFICMPMSGAEGVVGTLSLAHPRMHRPDQRLLRWLESLANYLASLLERQRSHDRLRESEERTRKMIEAALDAVVSIDADGRITGWNGQAERIFGYSAEEALGRHLTETIIPVQYAAAHENGLKRFLHTGEARVLNQRIEMAARTKFGNEFPVELAISSIRSGDTYSFTAFIRDITARKRYEHELAKARDAALDAAKLKSEFLANMSHEIRTPMNGVIGMTDLLLDTSLTLEQKDYAHTIRHSAEALLTVINDILDFSKIEAGKMAIDVTEVNLRELLEEVTDLLAPVAQEKNIELLCDVSPLVPSIVRTDPVRVRQVVNNLVGNAIKFTEVGQVIVKCDILSEEGDKANLRITVIDSGIGIPADRQKTIFDSFTQVDGSTTRKFGGTGLGLTISKQLAVLLGGDIGLSSEVGAGSSFWLDLVAEIVPSQPSFERIAGLDDATPVLVVERHPGCAAVLERELSRFGFRVHLVESAEAGIEKVRAQQKYGVILIDTQTPDLAAEDFTSVIGELAPNTKLIMLSPIRDALPREEVLGRGFSGIVTKPVKLSQLYYTMIEAYGASVDSQDDVSEGNGQSILSGGFRILLAEDNVVNRKVATRILTRLGHHITCAENGYEAVKLVMSTQFDLALMDVQMPKMDGIEATEAIRNEETATGKHLPIIAMTAHVMKGDRERCLEAGMDDYLSKPITPEKIEKTLRKWERLIGDRRFDAA
jgi:PAS domain S-box-containing protein